MTGMPTSFAFLMHGRAGFVVQVGDDENADAGADHAVRDGLEPGLVALRVLDVPPKYEIRKIVYRCRLLSSPPHAARTRTLATPAVSNPRRCLPIVFGPSSGPQDCRPRFQGVRRPGRSAHDRPKRHRTPARVFVAETYALATLGRYHCYDTAISHVANENCPWPGRVTREARPAAGVPILNRPGGPGAAGIPCERGNRAKDEAPGHAASSTRRTERAVRASRAPLRVRTPRLRRR